MKKLLFIFSLFFCVSGYAEDALTLKSTATMDEGVLPALYSCQGKNISPQLNWTNTNTKVKSFALIFYDEDAPGGKFHHWVLYNIPATATELPEGISTLSAPIQIIKNDFNHDKYEGPCPPTLDHHRYKIILYGLDRKLPNGITSVTALNEYMKSHILEQATLSFYYVRFP